MVTVGHERRGADALPHPHPIDGYDLVPGEADDSSDDDEPNVVDGCGVDEALDRLPSGECAGDRNHQHDEEASDIFRTPVSERVALAGSPSPNDERDPKRDRREGVPQ